MKKSTSYPLIGLAVGVVVSLSISAGLFVGLESFFEDILYQKKPISNDVVILAIDNESIQRVGQWPWPRNTYAELINRLNENKPSVLGLDVVFSERSRLGQGDDAGLQKSLDSASFPIVMAVESTSFNFNGKNAETSKNLVPIYKSPNTNISSGLVNVITDSDNVVRRFPLFANNLSTDVLESVSNGKVDALAYAVVKKSGKYDISIDPSTPSVSRIVYAGDTNSFRRIPIYRLLEDKAVAKELSNKIVFLGATAENLHDSKSTPMSRGTEMPGVEIHANIANMLISGDRLNTVGNLVNIISILMVATLCSLTFVFFERLSAIIALNILIALLCAVFVVILFGMGFVLNLVHLELSVLLSTASMTLYRIFIAEKEKRDLKKMFGKYVSPAVLDQIVAHPEKVTLGGEEKEVTVLFADIRSFTTMSEKTAPKELVRILNTYFSGVTEKIIENDGVLDKYIGDAIMAFWGAPIEDNLQADHAVTAGKQMLEELKNLNEEFVKNGDPEIHIGIGIYTGMAVVGNVGSQHRFDYTVIGDTVNAASRLEGLNKEYKTQIIIGEGTKNKLTKEYKTSSLGAVSVKGKFETINIYSVE